MEKRYYIYDLIKILGISRNTYYNWEKSEKVPESKRDPINNYRYWTLKDIEKIKRITDRK